MNLKDKVVVITGASRGLGKNMAKFLIDKGAQVIISARPGGELENTAQELSCDNFPCDVTNEKQVRDLAGYVMEKYGRIDIWINNAGIWLPHDYLENVDTEKIRRMFEVNVYGAIYGCDEALRIMKGQNSGTIVNIISTSALEGRDKSAAYCASKFAVRGLTDSLRVENSESNLQIFGIYPCGMKTDLFGEAKPEEYDSFLSVEEIAREIIENLAQDNPELNQIFHRK
jgi:NAD(P)-dependent dehydrogenase (short-subunit alcohol dehydrogenase family)